MAQTETETETKRWQESRDDEDGRSSKKPKTNKNKRELRKGPRIRNSLRKHIERQNCRISDEEEVVGVLGQEDNLYEYEEAVPEEESRKNRRFDLLANLDYQLPGDFEDENVSSDDDDHEAWKGRVDEGVRIRLVPSETTYQGVMKTRKRNIEVVSEYNPTHDILDGEGVL